MGNIQFRPFNAQGAIRESGRERRAVTMFELVELKSLANQPQSQVILMVRPCSECRNSRAAALRTILGQSALHVFTDLVIDELTALDLVGGPGGDAAAG